MRHAKIATVFVSAALMTSGLAATAAATPSTSTGARSQAAAVPNPGTVKKSGKWCTYSKWGGTFYCKSDLKYKLPNKHFQVFVIGTNKQAYSRWSSPSGGVSKWTSLGGTCTKPGSGSIGMAWVGKNKWNFAITCIGSNNKRYYNERSATGKWSGWRLNKYKK